MLFLFEGFIRYGGFATYKSSPERNWHYYTNTYSGDSEECTFQDTLESHPYLGWLTGPVFPCKLFIRNNRGFWDRRDLPFKKDTKYYTVLILGGSVAGQFARGSANDTSPRYWLEEELNKRFVSPNGKPFRVLSGAMGGWRMPVQITTTAMYANSVDAIISLDGYNEALSQLHGSSIDKPDTWTWYYVQNQNRNSGAMFVIKMLKYFRIYVSRTPILKDSKALFSLYEGVQALFMKANVGETRAVHFQFSYPKSWSRVEIDAANIQKWKSYMLALRGTAQALNLKYAHFVQPIPTIDKKLTEKEKRYAHWLNGDMYKKIIVNPALELAKSGFPVESLVSVFKDVDETVYNDEIHCGYDKDLDSLGYRIMAKSMASSLGHFWKLKAKKVIK